eukprot:UN21002
MIILGFVGKFAGFFLTIPKPVLGGIITVLFAIIAVSGFKLIINDLECRRTQFIIACSLGIGLGIAIVGHGPGEDIEDDTDRIILDR